jgi:hypothetical protein
MAGLGRVTLDTVPETHWEDGARGGGKGMAGVAAALGDSGQPAGEHLSAQE